MKKALLMCLLVCFASLARAQSAPNATPAIKPAASCKVFWTLVYEDSLHNVDQGMLATGWWNEKSGLKWLEKMYKKYPDVCYVAPGTNENVAFFVGARGAVYQGTRIVTSQNSTSSETSGTVTDDEGNSADIDATTTGTTGSSVAVPYSVNYSVFTLTALRVELNGRFTPVRRFQVEGLYHTMYGIPIRKGSHSPKHAVEEAIQWLHSGGLNSPMQTVAAPGPK